MSPFHLTDLKPENIMLRKTRGDAVIKLIDFGCSEVLSHPEEEETGIRLPSRALTHQEGATTAYCKSPSSIHSSAFS